MKNMKTLVVHPIDRTTDSLSEIYKGKDWKIIRSIPSKSELKRLIKSHDRIIMMGHGCPNGLLSADKKRLIIDSSMVQFLRDKQCIGIWCYADQFFRKYKIPYACTGMIISEYDEAIDNCISCCLKDIDDSNEKFAKTIAENIDNDLFIDLVIENYKIELNPIVEFNSKNIFKWNNGYYY